MVHVDAAAPWRSEDAAGSTSQDTQDTQIQWSLFSWFHAAPRTVFSIRFPVVSCSESRGVFLVVLVIWCYLPRIFPQFHETCFMFLLCRMFTSPHPLRRCVGKQTTAAPELQLRDVVWSDESFFRLREQPNHQNTRICWGQPCLAIVSAHVFFAIYGACKALSQIIFKPSVERRVRFWRIFGHFFQPVTPKDWAAAQHFKDRCACR